MFHKAVITIAENLPEQYVAGYILAQIQLFEQNIVERLMEEPDYSFVDILKDSRDKLYLYANSIGLNTMEIQQSIEAAEKAVGNQ
jgi:hypothetical protein|nr:MAG TPA: hypothetical protein [Caudoviricetes sp.]